MNHKNIEVVCEEQRNKQDKIKTFFTRAKTSGIIAAYYVIVFILALLADKNWIQQIPNSWKFIFAFLMLLFLIPIMFFVSKEIVDLTYIRKRLSLILTFSIMFCYTMLGSLLYMMCRYDFIGNIHADVKTWIWTFFGIVVGGIITIIVCSLLVAIFSKDINSSKLKQNILYYPALMLLSNIFFLAFIYTALANGWLTALIIIAISNLSDVFAYVGGVLFGQHKIAPKISPKKTWEGAIFSIVVTIGVMLAFYAICNFDSPITVDDKIIHYPIIYLFCGVQFTNNIAIINNGWWYAILLAITFLLIFISMCGDMFFSKIKRSYEIKNFANLLPGHGGILDRLDALTFVFVSYYAFSFIVNFAVNPSSFEHLWF